MELCHELLDKIESDIHNLQSRILKKENNWLFAFWLIWCNFDQ
jgi:hypothetical protein